MNLSGSSPFSVDDWSICPRKKDFRIIRVDPTLEPYAAGASRSKRCHIGGGVGFVDSARERKTKRAQWLRFTVLL